MTSPRTRSPRNSSRSFDADELALACVSARSSKSASLNECPSDVSRAAREFTSIDSGEKPMIADFPGPSPDFPQAAVDREEDKDRLADQLVGRDIPHIESAVVGIVAVVAHHEVMARRDDEGTHIVDRIIGMAREHEIALAVRQRLAIARDMRLDAGLVGFDIVADARARHRFVVQIDLTVDDLDAVAGKADAALDEIFAVFRRIDVRHLEDDHVAALRLRCEDATGYGRESERERVAAVAISELLDEQIVADEQRRLHRAGRNVERLEKEGADHERNKERVDDRLDGFGK